MRISFLLLLSLTASQTALAQDFTERTTDEIEQRVRAMKKADVAWRKIPWRTCLVDALHASKEQKKPIIAWIFIDRPKDDERC